MPRHSLVWTGEVEGRGVNDSISRNEAYDWALRHGLYDPYGFAVHYDHLWESAPDLTQEARRWQRRHLQERKQRFEKQAEELRRKIEIVNAELERNETERFEG